MTTEKQGGGARIGAQVRSTLDTNAVPRLDLKSALYAWFDGLAESPDRENDGPFALNGNSLAWAAYCAYLLRITKDGGFGGHRRETGRSRMHLSSLSKSPGWDCDLYVASCLAGERRFKTLEMLKSPETWAGMLRVFHFGKGVEISLYPLIIPALEFYYGARFELLEIEFERPVYGRKTVATGEEIELLIGTCDIYLRYTLDGVEASCVWDCKSTSEGQAEKRTPSTGKRTEKGKQEVEAEVEYTRQVSSYLEPTGSDYGGLIFWIKIFPHRFQQSYVDRSPPRYARQFQRVKTQRQQLDSEDGHEAMGRVGPYCVKCPFWRRCGALRLANPALFAEFNTPKGPQPRVRVAKRVPRRLT